MALFLLLGTLSSTTAIHAPSLVVCPRRIPHRMCAAEDARASITRQDLLRLPLYIGWAYATGTSLRRVANFPPPSFNAIAQEIYSSAATSGPMVLEIGAGIKCASVFGDRFAAGCEVVAVDIERPDEATLQAASAYAQDRGYSFRFQLGDATSLGGIADASFDSVVCSLTLCSVPSVEAAVAEVRRVLKPGGRFGFIEHVRTTEADAQPLLGLSQRLLDPAQQALAHNCHLRRDTADVIVAAFGGMERVPRLQRMVNDDMWPVSQLAAGIAVKA